MSGQFGTGAKVSYGHFSTRAEMSHVQNVLGLKCLDTRDVKLVFPITDRRRVIIGY